MHKRRLICHVLLKSFLNGNCFLLSLFNKFFIENCTQIFHIFILLFSNLQIREVNVGDLFGFNHLEAPAFQLLQLYYIPDKWRMDIPFNIVPPENLTVEKPPKLLTILLESIRAIQLYIRSFRSITSKASEINVIKYFFNIRNARKCSLFTVQCIFNCVFQHLNVESNSLTIALWRFMVYKPFQCFQQELCLRQSLLLGKV